MSAWALVRTLCVGVASASLALGCVVQSESGGSGGYAGGGSGSGSGSSSGGTGASAQPMLVDVDPDQVLDAAPGQGVGVFVQYKTGGHWTVWWTCDTSKTSLDCSFDNTVSVSTGAITNLAAMTGSSTSGTQVTDRKVEATTTTTTGVDGITFDTPFATGQTPVITLEATINGTDNGSFLFFVQGGEVNGGFKGTLTDPLMLEPSKP